MACCMKSIAISNPNNSPATRVNLLIMEQAPKMANEKSRIAVHTHTLRNKSNGLVNVRLEDIKIK